MFNPAISSSTGLTFSNANNTVTTTAGAYSSGVSSGAASSGKLYAELKADSMGGTNAIAFGVGTIAANLSNVSGVDGNSVGYSNYDHNARSNGITFALPLPWTTGGILAIAVDLNTQDVWFRGSDGLWNGRATADPATGVEGLKSSTFFNTALVGLAQPSQHLIVAVYNNSQGTLNTGGVAFLGSVPAGFVGWDPTVSPLSTSAAAYVFFMA